MNDEERCETCKYWVHSDCDLIYGECHRLPPLREQTLRATEGGVLHVGTWPSTDPNDWCGEWKER